MSTRYATPIALLIALALVPVVIHSYVGATATDGRRVSDVPLVLGAFTGAATVRDATWGQRHFESEDWFERTYRDGSAEVVLTVVRSYDLKRLYHHAELDIAYGIPFVTHDVTRALGDERPVHLLRTDDGKSIAAYALHYGEAFVEHPYRLQLRTAGELLVSPRRPMTLFFARQSGVSPADGIESLAAGRVLQAAVDEFVAQAAASRR